MKALFLDIASNTGCLACVTNDRTVHLEAIDHRIDDSAFTVLIEEVIKKAGWSLKDLTHIACVMGPGGFTSLRVGVAAANALAYGLGIAVAGVHLSDVYAARFLQVQSSKLETNSNSGKVLKKENIVWLHSTKKTQLFVRLFNEDVSATRCVNLDELKSVLQSGSWTGELLLAHKKVVEQLGLKEAELRPLEEVLPQLVASERYGKETILPWYGRGW